MIDSNLASSIQSQASQCVKCGLCLPFCPTYGLTQNENESPRGRIALMHSMAVGALSLSLKAHKHIDNCLSCKECERVCPAGVPYESLLLNYRAWENPQLKSIKTPSHLSIRFFTYIVSRPAAIQALGKILWLTQQLGLIKIMRFTRLSALLPQKLPYPAPLKPYYPAIYPKQGTVALFTGCLSSLFDAQTNQDAITVLQHLGYEVYVPKKQTCCGAIASHAGYASEASALFKKNVAQFSELALSKIDNIITTASGCASSLIKHSENTNPDITAFSNKVIDVSDFISRAVWPDEVIAKLIHNQGRFKHEKIAVHTPCTLRNSLKKPQVSQDLLNKLGFDCQKLQKIEQCCGSAGTHMLSHISASEALLDSALIDLEKIAPNRLVTSNIGCALHFQKRFTAQKKPIRVCHPVSLFAEMLANS